MSRYKSDDFEEVTRHKIYRYTLDSEHLDILSIHYKKDCKDMKNVFANFIAKDVLDGKIPEPELIEAYKRYKELVFSIEWEESTKK